MDKVMKKRFAFEYEFSYIYMFHWPDTKTSEILKLFLANLL